MVNPKPKYKVGDRVLVNSERTINECWLPGTVKENIGLFDTYDSRLNQPKNKIPIRSFYYDVSLDEGNILRSPETRILKNPLNKFLS